MNLFDIINKTLEEDNYKEDLTSKYIPTKNNTKATITAKASGVVCGQEILTKIFHQIDPTIQISIHKKDGNFIQVIDKPINIYTITGKAQAILAGERTALNFLQHLSGIATLTQKFIQKLDDPQIKIRDTRKTTPLLRDLEKYAVTIGGGTNQRRDLSDQILFKDNHWLLLQENNLSLFEYIKIVRTKHPQILIQIEAENQSHIKQALDAEVDLILLDNMSICDIINSCEFITNYQKKETKIEISGGISLQNIHQYKNLPINFISIGALTHSAPALDFSLNLNI